MANLFQLRIMIIALVLLSGLYAFEAFSDTGEPLEPLKTSKARNCLYGHPWRKDPETGRSFYTYLGLNIAIDETCASTMEGQPLIGVKCQFWQGARTGEGRVIKRQMIVDPLLDGSCPDHVLDEEVESANECSFSDINFDGVTASPDFIKLSACYGKPNPEPGTHGYGR